MSLSGLTQSEEAQPLQLDELLRSHPGVAAALAKLGEGGYVAARAPYVAKTITEKLKG